MPKPEIGTEEPLKRPSFVTGSWVVLAYVPGKYNPPGAKKNDVAPAEFLALCVSREESGFALITFDPNGALLAFHRCGRRDSHVEFALIDAWLNYRVPFEQWSLYSVDASEQEILGKLGMIEIFESSMKGLSRVLHLARLKCRPDFPRLEPMFLISPRSDMEIHDDRKTLDVMWRYLLGVEADARRKESVRRTSGVSGDKSDEAEIKKIQAE